MAIAIVHLDDLAMDDGDKDALRSIERIDIETGGDSVVLDVANNSVAANIRWVLDDARGLLLGELTEDQLFYDGTYLRVFDRFGGLPYDSMRDRNVSCYGVDGALIGAIARTLLDISRAKENRAALDTLRNEWHIDNRGWLVALRAARSWFPQPEFEAMRSLGTDVGLATERAIQMGLETRAIQRMLDVVYGLTREGGHEEEANARARLRRD